MPVTSYNDSESCTIRCTIHCRLQLIADCSSQMVRRLLTVATIAYARGGLPFVSCLLYTSDAADDLTRVDLGGRWHLVRMKLSHKLTIAFRQLLLRHRRRVGEAEQLTTFTHRSAKLKQKLKSYRHAEIHIGSALDNFVTLTF